MTRLLALALVLAACGGSDFDGAVTDGGAGTGCDVAMFVSPPTPIAGPTTEVRVDAIVHGATGVVSYGWQVSRAGAPVRWMSLVPKTAWVSLSICRSRRSVMIFWMVCSTLVRKDSMYGSIICW